MRNHKNNYETDQVQNQKMEQAAKQARKPEKKFGTVKLIIGAVVVGMIAGVAFEGGQYVAKQFAGQKVVSSEKIEDSALEASSTSTTSSDVSAVVQNVMPSIVAIDTTVTETASYFGQMYSQEETGSGSGIIIGENDGELLIVTNNHVIEGEDAKVTITFQDETTAKAEVKGTDSDFDLAVLAVDKSDLTADTKSKIRIASMGDSDQVQVGDMSIAIGNALGYGQSVTVGYISAKDREVTLEDSSMTLLQTDAAINPGHSGGALLNAAGEVIGINSVKYSSEEVEGMGYAIPISKAVPIINDLMNREQLAESEQGYLGIRGKDITEDVAEVYSMPEGIYVGEVTDGSPADKGGILSGDIITKMDDKTVKTLEELQEFLTYTKAGTVVTVTVMELDDGEYQEKNLQVTLGHKSRSAAASSATEAPSAQDQQRQQLPFGN